MNTLAGIVPSESVVELPRFQTNTGERSIELSRIVYVSAQVNYSVFHLEGGESILTSLPLSIYAPLLEKHGFMRIHKSYLLNLKYLDQCSIRRFMLLTLPCGHTLTIARRRRTSLKKQLTSAKV